MELQVEGARPQAGTSSWNLGLGPDLCWRRPVAWARARRELSYLNLPRPYSSYYATSRTSLSEHASDSLARGPLTLPLSRAPAGAAGRVFCKVTRARARRRGPQLRVKFKVGRVVTVTVLPMPALKQVSLHALYLHRRNVSSRSSQRRSSSAASSTLAPASTRSSDAVSSATPLACCRAL